MNSDTETELLLERLYEALGISGRDATRTVASFEAHADERNAELPHELAEALRLYDEFLLWSIDLSTVLNFQSEPEVLEGQASYGVLSGAITAHLAAVRRLVLAGFDAGAKQIVRGLAEHCDALLLLIVRPELAASFATPDDWKASNEFWHRNIKSERARKAAFGARDENFTSSEWWKDWSAFRQGEDTLLSLSSHPSYIGAWVTTWGVHPLDGEMGGPGAWPGYLGTVSTASARTLEYAMFAVVIIAAAMDLPYGKVGGLPALARREGPLVARVERGRHILVAIVEHLCAEGEAARARLDGAP